MLFFFFFFVFFFVFFFLFVFILFCFCFCFFPRIILFFTFILQPLGYQKRNKREHSRYLEDGQADRSLCWSHCLIVTFVVHWFIFVYVTFMCDIDITKTCLYNFDPLEPHFYIVKLGFTGVYIIFLITAQNIDCVYSLEPPRRGGSNEYPQSMF